MPVLQTLTCASGSHWCHLSDSQASLLGCPWKYGIQSTPQVGNKCSLWHHITHTPEGHLPTQLLDQGSGIPSDVARKFNSINAFQNDVVGLHGVRSSKRRCSCRKAELLTSLTVQYATTITCIRYEVLVSVNIKCTVSWNVVPCGLADTWPDEKLSNHGLQKANIWFCSPNLLQSSPFRHHTLFPAALPLSKTLLELTL